MTDKLSLESLIRNYSKYKEVVNYEKNIKAVYYLLASGKYDFIHLLQKGVIFIQ